MSRTRLFQLSLVVAIGVGCSSDPTSPQLRAFDYSAAARACGPAGGPAVMVFLAPVPVRELNPGPPHVRMYVPVGAAELTAHAWPIGSGMDATAWFQSDSSTSEIARSGSMIVHSFGADSTINGSLELEFPNAGRMTSEFHAKWLASNFYCFQLVLAEAFVKNSTPAQLRSTAFLASSGTDIQAFDQDVWARTWRYDTIPVRSSLELFRVLRESNLALLRSLEPAEWDMFGVHAERGIETVRDIAMYHAGHDVNHFRQIEAICATHRV